MKVLLIKDVYKLGRAGDVKKVANGYGRNYLIPQGLAVLATPGALKQSERIRKEAEVRRAIENKELSGLAEQLGGLELFFPVKAGETGKLYGSVTTQMIANAINEELGVDIERRQLDTQPIRMLGVHKVDVRLTIDLIPEITVLVHREDEAPESAYTFIAEEESEAEEVAAEAEVLPEEKVEAEEEPAKETDGDTEDETLVDENESSIESTTEETEEIDSNVE